VRAWIYSRWDGSQEAFSLDAGAALDALSELMMEGMDAREALEWMRQHGFEPAGLDMRVMGSEELIRELRDEAEELARRYDLGEALSDPERRLEELLDREQRALEAASGFESERLNDFLARRHAGDAALSDRIERLRDHRLEDEEAGRELAELLEELERMRRLERFLAEQGQRFRGPERADYETAQAVRERMEALQRLARDLAEGRLEQVSAEELGDLLGEEAARSLVLVRDLEAGLRREGFLREHGEELTPRAIRRIGAGALADVYRALRKGLRGGHDAAGRGDATPLADRTRPWRFGDPLDVDVVRTVLNAVERRAGTPGGGLPVELQVEDFAVRERDHSTQTTTVLLLDMSWSMSWAGRFPAAKRVALAMDHLIRTRFPRDHFAVVGFSTRARELAPRELPEVAWDMGDPFTNLQEGLMLADRIIRRNPSPSPQILVITDGQPTAYFQQGQLRVEWPMGFGGVSPHAVSETLGQVRRVTARGITINTFMLDDAPELVGFVERMTQINRGRAFFTQPQQLGSFLMVDYISRRRTRRG